MKRLIVALALLLILLLILAPSFRNLEHASLDPQRDQADPAHYLKQDQGLVWYERAGPPTGQTVLLVHGFSVPSHIFDPTFRALADAGFDVIRFDLYGRGRSDRPAGDYDRKRFEQQIEGVLSALKVRAPVDMVGLSMGGALVASYATQHPAQVRRVVLIDPFNTARDISPLHLPLVGEWLMRVKLLPAMAAGQMSDFVAPEKFPDWSARYAEQMRYEGFGRAILSTLRHTIPVDPLPSFVALGASGKPVLLIWGEQDQTTPYAQHTRVQQALGKPQFLSVPNAGHLPHLEQPQLVEPVLLAFLQPDA